MTELDQLSCGLNGINLIEASAGTGKTYAITSLYLRLVVEKGLAPEDILVVTYTEAATEELRARIRDRLRSALDAFVGGVCDNPFLAGLTRNDNGLGPGREAALDRLQRAIHSFDTAAIFTIHGFCFRALQENAFESGSLYDTELVTDQGRMLREVVDDFWRERFLCEPALLLGYALRNGISPDELLRFVIGITANPKMTVFPRYTPEEVRAIEEGCRELFLALRERWREEGRDVASVMESDAGLSRSADAYRRDLLPALFGAMDSFASGENPFDLFDGFERFTSPGIACYTKPTGKPPVHPFFDLCEALAGKVKERFLALRWECLDHVRERLPLRKREVNIRFFDDLLNDLWFALQGRAGEDFARILRGRYRAALIDEFQDTDPVQYEIFRRIFTGPEAPLFLIGDPKQAIYSFRGADIFAYMEAVRDVEEDRRFTLTGNWRSSPRLLNALNTLFTNGTNPFVFGEIGYHRVRSGRPGGEDGLVLEGGDAAPLRLWVLPAGENGSGATVGTANEAVPMSVAAEIARLVGAGREGKALIGHHPLLPGDIAVIVRSHRQAGYIQEELNRLSVPSVMRSDRSIFATPEAGEMLTLLAALADPGNASRLRAALVTGIIGLCGDDIARLQEDETSWEEWLERFGDYHRLWRDSGFMVMFQSLLTGEGVRGRLLRQQGGERKVTNLLHCAEVIHNASHERGLGIGGAVAWFSGRDASGDGAEEYQIRLETDDDAVKIVTVHVSKGLEYPVVFVPFMWGGVRVDKDIAVFHDGHNMVRDFGSPDLERHLLLARREALAEGLRLLYVALTRAKYRCYLIAGKVVDRTGRNRPETSPLAWLLHSSPETRKASEPFERMAGEAAAMTAKSVEEQLQSIAAEADGDMAVESMPEPGDAAPLSPDMDEGELSCRYFGGEIVDDWRVASFTSFTAHGAAAELPDRDETAPEPFPDQFDAPPEGASGKSIFTFPRGAQAGIFLHGIFEELDFAGYTRGGAETLVLTGLDRYGYDGEWFPHILSMVENVVNVPLESGEGSFTLASLESGKWLTELEFYFPLRFLTASVMVDLFRRWGENGAVGDGFRRICSALRFRPVRGMVRGFMDMVFEHGGRYYLVDWKSNHLGNRPDDYRRERLNGEMSRRLYPLQYLLYTVALNRYLSSRVKGYDYGRHFGGVLYIFLRGVDKGRGEEAGIFRDLPPRAMIEDLTGMLIQAGG